MPLTLEKQFVSEIHWYVKHHTFNLFSYTTVVRGRHTAVFWAKVDKRKLQKIFQIFVMMLTVSSG